MIGFHIKHEGDPLRQGINWCWDKASKPILALKLWRFIWYWRRRSDWIMKASRGVDGNPINFPRHIFGFDIIPHSYGSGSMSINFDERTLTIGKRTVTYDLLDLLLAKAEQGEL